MALAGIAFFVYGINVASENLQKLAAERIRNMLATLSRQPVWALLFGMSLTLILQSSGAVISMLVSLGSARVISLPQVMGLILGSTIGSTFTIQILSFDVARFGLGIFASAFILYFLSRRRAFKQSFGALMGIGICLWGLELIRFSTAGLEQLGAYTSVFQTLKEHPFYVVGIAAALTAAVQSSAVTIGLAMTLAGHGVIETADSVYWIFGANIGTTATAIIASTGSNYVGRQIAWAHFFYKVMGVALFFPFAPKLVQLIAMGSPLRDVANINTVYNLAAALVFYPGIGYGARWIERLFPPSDAEKEYTVRYLSKEDWHSPSIAMAHAERELLRMADVVVTMVDDSLTLFRKVDPDFANSMRTRDDQVDLLARELNLYMARSLESAPISYQHQMMSLMNFTADLEGAADVVNNQLMKLAAKKHHLRVDFSADGWQELEEMAAAVSQVVNMSIVCYQRQDIELAEKIVFHKRNVRRLEKRMRESHMARLVKGTPESVNTSSIHLDVLSEYRRIVGLISNHVYSLIKDTDRLKASGRD